MCAQKAAMLTPSLDPMRENARRLHVSFGTLLEVGPGSVFPGLDWLAKQPDLDLVGVGYTEPERVEALAQAAKLGVGARVNYPDGPARPFPLAARSVDAVVSFGAVHQWPEPLRVLDEVARVLKPGGKLFFGDVRKDLGAVQATLWAAFGKPGMKAVYKHRQGALTAEEAKALFAHSRLVGWSVRALGPDWWVASDPAA
jgi:SAM-dependent methyltransferase